MSLAVATTHTPVRDRVTWISYVQISFFAWFMYSFGATQALLRDEQGTGLVLASLHGTFLSIGGLLAAVIVAKLMLRYGRGRILRLGSLGTILGALVLTWPGVSIGMTFLGVFLAGFFGTFIVATVNAFLLDHEGPAGPAALTEANALACFTGLLGPLVVGIGAATFLGWRAGMYVVIIALVAVEIWRGRNTFAFGEPPEVVAKVEHGKIPKAFWWAWALLVCVIGAEFSIIFWGADLLRERCGFGPSAAAASLASVVGGMFIGRAFGSRLARAFNTESILRVAMTCALVSFAIAWAFTWWPVVILGLFLTGLSISVHWPLSVARAVVASDGLTDRAAGLASVAASIASGIAPFALGALSQSIGFHLAFLLMPVFLISGLAILLIKPVREIPVTN